MSAFSFVIITRPSIRVNSREARASFLQNEAIDRSTCRASCKLRGDRKGEIMLRQVVRLCYELGLYTTAEGVEAEDQVDFLRALDCTDIQGYFFSPPLPVEKYTEKLRQQARKRA